MQCRYLAESKIYGVPCGGEISDSGWLFNLAGKNTVVSTIGWKLEPDKFRVEMSLNTE